MPPREGLGQAAKAVERAMAALAKREGPGSAARGGKEEVGVVWCAVVCVRLVMVSMEVTTSRFQHPRTPTHHGQSIDRSTHQF